MILESLDKPALISRIDKLGLRNAGHLERLAADFDAHRAISEVSDCHVRGGMCMLFHVDDVAQRISVDIDMYTPDSAERMRQVVPDALKSGGFVKVVPLATRPGMPLSDLVRFTAMFVSSFGSRSSISVDIACGADMGLIDTVTVPAGRHALGFYSERDISALSRASLIADKMPSLGIGTVGYRSLKSTPKQIYDVGTLLQHSGMGDLESALSTYAKLTAFKMARDSRGHGLGEVTRSIVKYLDGIGRTSTSPEAKRHRDDFMAFSQSMLPKRRSDPQDHAERILLCLLLARSLSRSIGPGASCADEAAALYATLEEAHERRNVGDHIAFLRKRLGMDKP